MTTFLLVLPRGIRGSTSTADPTTTAEAELHAGSGELQPQHHQSTILMQPHCNDAHLLSSAIFTRVDEAQVCSRMLTTFRQDLAVAEAAYEGFLKAMDGYEWNQNRLCRWQRLVKEAPESREAHEQVFRPVARAWRDVEGGREVARRGWTRVRHSCWGEDPEEAEA